MTSPPPDRPYRGRYKAAERYIIFNDDDEELQPIKYTLPVPPAIETIDGYGLKPEDQFFKMPVFSKRLTKLMNMTHLMPSQKWALMEEKPEEYELEIAFLTEEWRRIEEGYWFFNNGRPTYITGLHYFFMVYWALLGTKKVFRMSDREVCLFIKFCTDDPFCAGFNWLKGRRYGATSIVTCWRYYIAITGKGKHAGLQSKTDDDAEMVHIKHMVYAWRKMTFWVSPVYDGNQENKGAITFSSPPYRNNPDYMAPALDSWIDFKNSNEKAYDGDILHALHNDEAGKMMVQRKFSERWAVQRPCLEKGQTFIGKAINSSTVADMDNGGGSEFKLVADQSHYHQRDPGTNRTASGLYNFFMPDDEGTLGLDPSTLGMTNEEAVSMPPVNFIDKYGFCDKKTVREKILAERKFLRESGNMALCIEKTRQHPLNWKECWLLSAKDCQFDLEIIETILDKYRHGNPDVRVGNFRWENDVMDSRVVWEDDKNGRWRVSFLFEDESLSNSFSVDYYGFKTPLNDWKFVAGCDTFKYAKTKSNNPSMGGGAVFWRFDSTVDSIHTKPSLHKSNRFILTYNFRPKTPTLFAEDMLMTCIYYGCKMFPELNINNVWDYFDLRGYAGYMFYRVDKRNRLEEKPGIQMSKMIAEEIFQVHSDHISRNGMREKHPEIMKECKEIAGPEFITDFDLFTASGLALLGARKSKWNPDPQRDKEKYALDEYFEVTRYAT